MARFMCFVVIIAVIGQTAAVKYDMPSGEGTPAGPFWNDLKTTFMQFNKIQRTMNKAYRKMNWRTLLSNGSMTNGGGECENKFGDFEFNGIPLTNPEDKALVALYDRNGIIAGVQAYLPVDEVKTQGNVLQYSRVPMINKVELGGRQFYVVTAYFMQPDSICTHGRSKSEMRREGTATGLWFQNGPKPTELVRAPTVRREAIQQGWTDNPCLSKMGFHNFFQFSHPESMDCTDLRPVFLLFTPEQQLLGFGFSFIGNGVSKQFEHVNKQVSRLTIGNVPQCVDQLIDNVGISTLHVYLLNKPQDIKCTRKQ